MSDVVTPEEAPLPSLSREDVAAFVQVITALALMGATRLEIHAERWPLIFTGMILHRAFPLNQVTYRDGVEDIEHAVMHTEFATERGRVGCLLMQRVTREVETPEQCELLDNQGPAYDVPKLIDTADPKLWMPS